MTKMNKEMSEIYKETRNELLTKIVKTLTIKSSEIAEMVELYYDCQDFRIRNANRERTEAPSELAEWLDSWMGAGETVIKNKLNQWVKSEESPLECKWAYDQIGIGPVIASGLSAYIDVARAPYPSSVWKFAGLAPGYDRKQKGVKLPYNARLKVLAWKIGASFVKVSGKEGARYGQLYGQFKAKEVEKNESGAYREAAQHELDAKKFKTDTVTKKRLLEGKLSDGHLDARAKRKTVKIFLSHYWEKGREARGLSVPGPYSGDILGHSGTIAA